MQNVGDCKRAKGCRSDRSRQEVKWFPTKICLQNSFDTTENKPLNVLIIYLSDRILDHMPTEQYRIQKKKISGITHVVNTDTKSRSKSLQDLPSKLGKLDRQAVTVAMTKTKVEIDENTRKVCITEELQLATTSMREIILAAMRDSTNSLWPP